jgi:hypothetical protein
MVGNLITAYRVRISNLTWMSPQTKKKALAKLAAFRIGIGYPDTWFGYSTLDGGAGLRLLPCFPSLRPWQAGAVWRGCWRRMTPACCHGKERAMS